MKLIRPTTQEVADLTGHGRVRGLEGQGDRVDLSGRGRVIAPAIPQGIVTTHSIHTDGVDEWVGSSPNFAYGIGSAYTLIMWFYLDRPTWNDIQSRAIFSKGVYNSGHFGFRLLTIGTNQMRWQISDNGNTITHEPRINATLIQPQQWAQMVIVCNDAATNIPPDYKVRWWYANAADTLLQEAPVTDVRFPPIYDSPTAETRIAKYWSTVFGKFYWCDVAWFNAAMTPAEVQLTRDFTLPADLSVHPKWPNVKFWLRNGTGDSYPNVYDQGPYDHDFYMHNMDASNITTQVPT